MAARNSRAASLPAICHTGKLELLNGLPIRQSGFYPAKVILPSGMNAAAVAAAS